VTGIAVFTAGAVAAGWYQISGKLIGHRSGAQSGGYSCTSQPCGAFMAPSTETTDSPPSAGELPEMMQPAQSEQ
jgi:hypothetical protein